MADDAKPVALPPDPSAPKEKAAKDDGQSFLGLLTSIGATKRKTESKFLARAEKKLSPAERKKRAEEEHIRRKEAEEQRKLLAKRAADEKAKAVPPVEEKNPEDEKPLLPVKKKVVKRRSFKELLQLAGMDHDPLFIYKRVFLSAIIVNLVLTALALIMGYFFRDTFHTLTGVTQFLGFIAAMWTVFFAGVCILCFLAFTVYLDLRIGTRRKEIEQVFPDFLQLAAANLSAGMTVDRALWSAIRPRFGVLAKEMEDVAKKTMTGYDLERALGEFTEKYDSIVLKRSTNLIIEGIRSGGKMADILNKIAINMQENSILQKEMSANVTTYVIFIAFASVVAAPFLFGLATQLLSVIKQIAGSIGSSGGGGSASGLSINPNVIQSSDFRIYSFTILSVTSLMSACIVSVIRKGTIREGLRLLPFFWFISVSLYTLAAWGLGYLFAGIV